MARTTVKHVRQMAENVNKNMRKVGFLREDEYVILVAGSRTNGQPYHLHTTKEGVGGYGDTGLLPGYDGFLGWTAREALRSLEIVNAGLLRTYTYQSNKILAKMGTARAAFTGSASGEKHES